MGDMEQIIRAEARLIILRTLADDRSGSSNSSLLQVELESLGIVRSREFVHAELRHLADLGAVELTEAATVLVAQLTQRGLDHVERRITLDGVKRPSLKRI